MTGDLSVKLGNGKKLEAAASNEVCESFGVTVAKVNDKFEIEEVSNSQFVILFISVTKWATPTYKKS
jgi:hypothetical protein